MSAKPIAAVLRPFELTHNVLQANEFVKCRNDMALLIPTNLEPLSVAELSCKGVEASESKTELSAGKEDRGSALVNERAMQILNEELKSSDLPSFTIRNYVFSVRSKDLRKCWPFPQRLFESCLRYGAEPQLPPFDSPQYRLPRVLNDAKGQHTTINNAYRENSTESTETDAVNSDIQTYLEKEKGQEVLEVEKHTEKVDSAESSAQSSCQNECSNKDIARHLENKEQDDRRRALKTSRKQGGVQIDTVVKRQESIEKHRENAVKEDKCEDGYCEVIIIGRDEAALSDIEDKAGEAIHERRKWERIKDDVRVEEEELTAQGSKQMDLFTGGFSENKFGGVAEMEGGTPCPQMVYSKSEVTSPKQQVSRIFEHPELEKDHREAKQSAPKGCSPEKMATFEVQNQRMKCGDLLNKLDLRILEGEKQVVSNVQNFSEDSTGLDLFKRGNINPFVEENIEAEENTKVQDVSVNCAVDLGSMNQQIRGDDENGIIGVNPDGLILQLCPVCRNFTSTSNTALNAHIDHCLAVVTFVERSQSKLRKRKIKPRKKRSMADICAVAPTRTLEDLEISSQRWALTEMTSVENLPCSLGWKGREIRRQPRSHLCCRPAETRTRTTLMQPKQKRQRLLADSDIKKRQEKWPLLEEENCFEIETVKKRRQGIDTNHNAQKQESSNVNISSNIVPQAYSKERIPCNCARCEGTIRRIRHMVNKHLSCYGKYLPPVTRSQQDARNNEVQNPFADQQTSENESGLLNFSKASTVSDSLFSKFQFPWLRQEKQGSQDTKDLCISWKI